MGSLNWASGLIPLGRLHLRPLQRHFHSLDLTNQFTQPCRSDPLVVAILLRQWQDLSFLMSGIPVRPFQAEFTISTEASTQGLGAHMGNSHIAGVWTRSECKLHNNVLELKAVILALQHWVAVLQGHHIMIATDYTTFVAYINKQGGTHSHALFAAGSRSVSVATDLGQNSSSQTHSGLLQCDSRPVISAEPAHHNRVESPPKVVNLIFRLWGTPVVDMFATVHNMHLPQFISPLPEPGALAIDALSQDWQGRSMYMFPRFPLLSKVIQKLNC